jgi:transcription antitermination factor NusG
MEQFLAGQLASRQMDCYLPQYKVNPVNPRSKKNRPLFPGYLFVRCRAGESEVVYLERAPGAIGLVNLGGEAAYVPENMLEAIQRRVERMNLNDIGEFHSLKNGDRVRIHSGLFEGYEAIFDTRLDGSDRVRVLLKLLENRLLELELPAACVI